MEKSTISQGRASCDAMAFRTERTANVRSLHTAHVGPRRTDVRSLTCSCLVRRVDEGWPTSSGSISTPRTTMYLSESGNRRDHEAKWGQKVRSHHVLSEPVPRARPNAHHPLTTSRAPDARCARCTPSPHPPLRAPDRAPCVPAGLVNFNPTAIELYVELDPHPGGWDHLLVAGRRVVCGLLRGSDAC